MSINRRVLLTGALLLVGAGLVVAVRGWGESFRYEIYELKGGRLESLGQGTAKADGSNVLSEKHVDFLGSEFEDKWIPLHGDFGVGAFVQREKRLDGFGLWIRRKDKGFSWNWFTRDSGNVFRQLQQGQGRARITLVPGQAQEELLAVEFLDDVQLTGRFGLTQLMPGARDTHEILIKKGSVLRLAP